MAGVTLRVGRTAQDLGELNLSGDSTLVEGARLAQSSAPQGSNGAGRIRTNWQPDSVRRIERQAPPSESGGRVPPALPAD
jgi:hypothetical protein